MGGDIGNPQSLNRYSYVMNNPASLFDPSGMQWVPVGPGSNYPSGCMVNEETDQVKCPPAAPPAEDIIGDLIASDPCGWFGPLFPGCGGGFGGGFGGSSSGAPQTQGRMTQVARCAANLANTMSVAHYAHLQNVPVASNIFSNDFSSLTNLFFGPGRPSAAAGLAENLGSGPAVSLTGKGAGAVTVDPGFQFLFSSVPATTAGETAIGGVLTKSLSVVADWLSGEAEAQAVYDAGVYSGAVYVCAEQ